MEYVKVTFPTDRLVYVDGEENGSTNEVLRVEAGTHVFELGTLANYRPASRTVTVQDTRCSSRWRSGFSARAGPDAHRADRGRRACGVPPTGGVRGIRAQSAARAVRAGCRIPLRAAGAGRQQRRT